MKSDVTNVTKFLTLEKCVFEIVKYIYMRLGYALFWLQFAKVGFSAAKIKIRANFSLKCKKNTTFYV